MNNTEQQTQKNDFITAGIFIILHVVISTAAFLILMVVFQFPDILRAPSPVRFNLFLENQNIMIPVYYLLALTGLFQAIISVLLYQFFKQKNTLINLGLLFGILTGVFQTFGFIRWSFVIPYFADLSESSPEMIGVLEGAFNSYAGMAVGEHLGFIMQASWTIFLGVAILKTNMLSKNIGIAGIIIGALTVLFAYEPFGGIFTVFGELTNPVESAWYIWLVFIGVSLFRKANNSSKVPEFGYVSLIIAVVIWLTFIIPAYI